MFRPKSGLGNMIPIVGRLDGPPSGGFVEA